MGERRGLSDGEVTIAQSKKRNQRTDAKRRQIGKSGGGRSLVKNDGGIKRRLERQSQGARCLTAFSKDEPCISCGSCIRRARARHCV